MPAYPWLPSSGFTIQAWELVRPLPEQWLPVPAVWSGTTRGSREGISSVEILSPQTGHATRTNSSLR